jgi:uncharacterized membrane protein
MEFENSVDLIGKGIEIAGIAAMVVGAVVAFGLYLAAVSRKEHESAFRSFRQNLGRAILLGLEFLVAGDIIQTVAISPTFTSVGVLALIVLVRTFLSFTLQLEIEGRLPWRRKTA